MKHIVLTDDLAELQDMTVSQPNKKEIREKWSAFIVQTRSVINGGVMAGHLRYTDVSHYKKVRRALKALMEFKTKKDIYLEDSDYDVLFGKEGSTGIIRQYGAWIAGDFTDSYIDAWENAKEESTKAMQAALRKEVEAPKK